MIILSTAYMPPISYMALIMAESEINIEYFENFVKQSYRNRCQIYSPNGVLNLVVPVQKGKDYHTLTKDVKISYEENWQRLHLMTLQTSYRSSAYFEYYEDEIVALFKTQPEYLVAWNEAWLKLILKFLKKDLTVINTKSYTENVAEIADFRNKISHKKDNLIINQPTYFQLFNTKYGWQTDLTILDLIFTMGPQASGYLHGLTLRNY